MLHTQLLLPPLLYLCHHPWLNRSYIAWYMPTVKKWFHSKFFWVWCWDADTLIQLLHCPMQGNMLLFRDSSATFSRSDVIDYSSQIPCLTRECFKQNWTLSRDYFLKILSSFIQVFLIPPFRLSCDIIFLHPVLKDTCTPRMCMNLVGAIWYDVNKQSKCTGAFACHNSGETEEVFTDANQSYNHF